MTPTRPQGLAFALCTGLALLLAAGAAPAQPAVAMPVPASPLPEASWTAPWRLGMTPAQVTAFDQFGPYTPVRVTGGVETANGRFRGKPANVSFVFDEAGLRYLQVWKYEGKDPKQAQDAVMDVFDFFASELGGVDPAEFSANGGRAMTREEFAMVVATTYGRIQTLAADIRRDRKVEMTFSMGMSPLRQPDGMRWQCQFAYSSRHDAFFVFLFQDRPDAPKRATDAAIHLENS